MSRLWVHISPNPEKDPPVIYKDGDDAWAMKLHFGGEVYEPKIIKKSTPSKRPPYLYGVVKIIREKMERQTHTIV